MFSISNFVLGEKISSKLLVEKLIDGKVLKVNSEIFIDTKKTTLISCYMKPEESVMISNSKGEVQVYFPKTNTVKIQYNKILSADNDILFYLLKTQDYDLGLKASGCKLIETKNEDSLMITIWAPPVSTKSIIKQIKQVYKDDKPIYSEYLNNKGEKISETFYYEYQIINHLPIPTKITEYLYLKNGKKIVSRKIYSDIKIGKRATNSMFNFKVPLSATSSMIN